MTLSSRHIYQAFLDSAEAHREKDAVLYQHGKNFISQNYAWLERRSRIMARQLCRKHHIRPGDRVALLLENHPEFAWSFLGVLAAGGVVVPLDVQYSPGQILRICEHAGAKIVISQTSLDYSQSTKGSLQWIFVNDLSGDENVPSQPLSDIEVPGGDDLAALFYTSGTTGEPKGVMLTHNNLLANVDAIRKIKVAVADDVVLSMLPLHHTYAFTTTLLTPLLIGATIAYPKSIASSDLMYCIKQACVTLMVSVPEVFKLLHQAVKRQMGSLPLMKRAVAHYGGQLALPLRKHMRVNAGKMIFRDVHRIFGPCLRMMISGGAKLDAEVVRDFYRWGFALIEGYGLTETSPVVAFSLPDDARFGSVGRPLPGVEAALYGTDEKGEGEIIVRGPNVMQGYYRSPEETRKVLRDGWLFTGDLGSIEADGSLTINGRKNDMIVLSSGENIYPAELEEIYARTPMIKEIGVFARDPVHEGRAQQLAAVIVPDIGYFQEIGEVDIRGKLKWELENIFSSLPSYKRLAGFVIFRQDLPRTRLGKLKRFELPHIYTTIQSSGKLEPSREEASVDKQPELLTHGPQLALTYLQKRLDREVSMSDHIELDLGLDSLERIEVLLEMQESLGLEVPEEDLMAFFSCQTVGELFERLKELLRHQAGAGDKDEDMTLLTQSALAYINKQLNVSAQPQDHLELDLGLDSLGRIELLMGLQEHLGLELSEDEAMSFFQCQTISELMSRLQVVIGKETIHGHWGEVSWEDIMRQDPSEQRKESLRLNGTGIGGKALNFFLAMLLKMLFKVFFLLRIEGRERLPDKGPYVICPNHTTYLDALFVMAALPFPVLLQTFFLGDDRFLSRGPLRYCHHVLRLIPIKFTFDMVDALRTCAYVLKHNRIVCYFPEGQRTVGHEIGKFKKGIGILLKEAAVPAVPVYLKGGEKVWPRGRKWPRPGRIRVVVGEPVYPETLHFELTAQEDPYMRIAEKLKEKMRNLKDTY